jgi:hypothetical protein
LGLEHQFPHNLEPHEKAVGSELALVRATMTQISATLAECRRVLLELQQQMTSVERQLTQVEIGIGPPPSDSCPVRLPALPADQVVDRVEQLRCACEAMLKRPLRAAERPVVLGWSELERDGDLVPVEEILQVAGRLLTQRTADGTLPGSLAWCDTTVRTLARGPARLPRPRRIEAAVEFASFYEKLADQLDQQEEGERA